jgi:hypothetical protein
MRRISMMVLCLAFLATLAACGGTATNSNTPTNTVASATATPTPPPTPAGNTIGVPVHVGNWMVTINKVSTSTGDQADVPHGIYLIIDASFQNTSSAGHSISSLIQFTLTDSTGQKYNPTIVGMPGIVVPDTNNVLPGKTVRGQTTYDVPTSQKSFEFVFTDVIAGGASAAWDFSV